VHKRTEATVKASDGKQFFVAKGAPQVILQMSTNADQVKPAVENAVNGFAGRGFRSLGVARADEQGKWQFAGVLPIVRSTPRAGESNHRQRAPDGRERQDGHGRSIGHRQRDRAAIGNGHEHPRRQRLGRHQAP
jgi:hypothetical protein